VLDVAGGTGDIAFRILESLRAHHRASDGARPSEVAVLDINDAMLGVGEQRATKKGYAGSELGALTAGDAGFLSWHQGDAMDLQFPDNSFDAYTIAFGIRNVTRVQDAVEEAFRVLKPGGRFMCLEFSHVPVPGLSQLYDAYSFNVVPAIGQAVAGNREAYQYLVESIRRFPDQTTFANMIKSGGFQNVTYENFTVGVCAVHSGFKPIERSGHAAVGVNPATGEVERDVVALS
jgi:ubiquinone/menaquinone biosynthesis methyltransferase